MSSANLSKKKTFDFSDEYIGGIIKKAKKLELQCCFSEEVWENLNLSALKKRCSIEYLLPGLLSTTSHLMGYSTIQYDKYYSQSMIFYTALLAPACSGKSPAMKFFTSAVQDIQAANQVPICDSLLSNTCTVEAVVELLKKHQRILSLYDEASEFFGCFGRYSNGGGSYDRGVFLSLYSAPEQFFRDLKSSRTVCINPLLNISINAHPSNWIKSIKEEKEGQVDGFMSRFLFCAPKTNYKLRLKDRDSSREPGISIVCLLYAVEKIASNNKLVFKLSHNAKNEFIKFDNELSDILEATEDIDEYIASIYGKSSGHVLKFAAFIATLNKTCELIRDAPDRNQLVLTNIFTDYVHNKVVLNRDYIDEFQIIDTETIQNSIKLLNYFNAHKLILSTYDFEIFPDASNLNQIVKQHLEKKIQSQSNTNYDLLSISDKQRLIITKVLTTNGSIVYTNELNNKHRINLHDSLEVFNKLQSLKLGSLEQKKHSKNRKTINCFIKKDPSAFNDDIELIECLHQLNITLEYYTKCYFNELSNETKIPTQNNKNNKRGSIDSIIIDETSEDDEEIDHNQINCNQAQTSLSQVQARSTPVQTSSSQANQTHVHTSVVQGIPSVNTSQSHAQTISNQASPIHVHTSSTPAQATETLPNLSTFISANEAHMTQTNSTQAQVSTANVHTSFAQGIPSLNTSQSHAQTILIHVQADHSQADTNLTETFPSITTFTSANETHMTTHKVVSKPPLCTKNLVDPKENNQISNHPNSCKNTVHVSEDNATISTPQKRNHNALNQPQIVTPRRSPRLQRTLVSPVVTPTKTPRPKKQALENKGIFYTSNDI